MVCVAIFQGREKEREDCVVVAQGAVKSPGGVREGGRRRRSKRAREVALEGEGSGGGVVEAERIHAGGEC